MRKWVTVIVLFLNACANTGDMGHSKRDIDHREIGQPAAHGIQSAQLRDLMDRMDILMQERFLTEHQVDIERRKYALRMASTANTLSKTVNAIFQLLPSLKLNSEDQNSFLSLAKRLDNQAQVLQKQAEANQIDAIGDSMDRISATCTTCHSLFRKPKR